MWNLFREVEKLIMKEHVSLNGARSVVNREEPV